MVGATDSKVELTLAEAPAVSGGVMFDGLSPVPLGTVIGLQSEETTRMVPRDVGSDGQFRFDAVAPGSYRLTVLAASGRRLPIHRLLVDGAPAKSQLLEISKSLRLEVSVTLEGGGVSGYVYRKDVAAPGALVVLAPRTDSANPFDYKGFQTDSDGSFEFPNVPPGDYVVFAVEDLADFEYSNPEAVRPKLVSGQPVRIEDGKSQSIRLELDQAPPAPRI